jgi:rod shape-determining protein MreC
MSVKPQWLSFGGVLLLVLVLLNLPQAASSRIRLILGTVYLPLFGATSVAGTVVSRARDAVTPRGILLRRTRELEQENRQLHLRLMQTEEALEENRRLRSLLGWREVSPWRLQAARVIARDTASWWRTVYIDAGARDGLQPDLPVLAAEGLVGRLGTVGPVSSEVILIGDPKCRVAVVVREAGENGVLTTLSTGVMDHRLVDLTHLARNTALQPGQTVFTSGLGGVFPAGLPVGTVVDWRTVGYGLYTEARVKLYADTSRLREVMVVLP